ncbi:FKBP-type peptidyl-prolyl cis-trans isomerase [Kaistella polysaccharea]|uniref:FKBP-type peptidyl-prolyl cis-trans isomerase n=1 Tax=Kaistella polysaccharea TaxID=2878534 RepID=UPI001CF166BE|nr:FKBP-type peptidyl-prolyl cis-trans isomerase [Kaistella polysaccharea]
MKPVILLCLFALVGCIKHTPSYSPAGKSLSQEDLQTSRERTKMLNLLEKSQIEDWIKSQAENYEATSSNYWINVGNLHDRSRKTNGEIISYQYEIYDFDWVKLYDDPIKNINVTFGRFEELKPIEDALRYINKGEEVILLIPSALGYGAVGDGDRISTDMPLIIKLKVL